MNLLQPQDRRSLAAGDSRETVEARARLLDAGVGKALIDAVAGAVAEFSLPPGAQVVDVGCGTGHALAAVAAAGEVTAIGVDLSTAAIDFAARRYPSLTWVVANADRQLPLTDASTQLLLSINARRVGSEAHRVLTDDGMVLMAVPAPDDLAELRASVQGEAVARDRTEALISQHAEWFTVARRWTVREQHRLDANLLRDLAHITYRGGRRSQMASLQALGTMTVTLASDVVLFSAKRREKAKTLL